MNTTQIRPTSMVNVNVTMTAVDRRYIPTVVPLKSILELLYGRKDNLYLVLLLHRSKLVLQDYLFFIARLYLTEILGFSDKIFQQRLTTETITQKLYKIRKRNGALNQVPSKCFLKHEPPRSLRKRIK